MKFVHIFLIIIAVLAIVTGRRHRSRRDETVANNALCKNNNKKCVSGHVGGKSVTGWCTSVNGGSTVTFKAMVCTVGATSTQKRRRH